MYPFGKGIPHCKRCGFEIDGGEDTCPRCQFSPRLKGLRVSMVLFAVVVVSMTIVMILPEFGPYLIRIAGIAFILSMLTFFVSFLATPYRLGSLFVRL